MTTEQMERRLRQLEVASKGLDYVRVQDELDAKEDSDKALKVEAQRLADVDTASKVEKIAE